MADDPVTPHPGGGSTWALAMTFASAVFGSMPAFLTGVMAVLLRGEMHFAEAGLGAAVSVFFGTAAVGSVPAGKLVERLGAKRGMLLGATGTTLTLAGIGLLARSWRDLVLLLVLGGAALAVTQPAANLALARGVRFERLGLAFGAKQSAIPMATLIGGAALPAIGLTLGWRWSFVAIALVTAIYAAALAARRFPQEHAMAPRPHGDAPPRHLVLLGVSAGLGMAAGNSLGAFYVQSAVAQGAQKAGAGLWLVVGSLFCIGARVLWGWLADRRNGQNLRFVMGLMAVGAASYVCLALASWLPLSVIAATVAFMTGWGWPGLLLYTVVRLSRHSPAASTSIMLTGAFLGGTIGPIGFGTLVEHGSYRVAWLVAATSLALGACCVLLARRRLAVRAEGAMLASAAG